MKKKMLIFILSLLCLLGVVYSIHYVSADSGWDSDYDSSDSWSSSSDWGSSSYDSDWGGSSYYSSGGDNSGGGIESFIIFVVIVIIIILVIRSSSKNSVSSKISSTPYQDVSDDVLTKYGINANEFKEMAYNKYLDIQKAWSEFDYDKLRNNLTDELYNSYIMQLDALKVKNQKNLMSHFKCLDTKITDVREENGLLNVSIYLKVEMYDYVVDSDDKVVRGTKNHKLEIQYIIKFVKTNKESNDETICPNCGAKIDAVSGGTCEYCGTVIQIDAKDYVMSRKTNVGQRRK